MLHALAATGSTREVWWLYGARNRAEHPFARECEELLRQLPRSRRYIAYSEAPASDPLDDNFNARGRLDLAALTRLGVPWEADFYLCGPSAFMQDFTRGLRDRGVPRGRIHSEIFGPGTWATPGIDERRTFSKSPFHPKTKKLFP